MQGLMVISSKKTTKLVYINTADSRKLGPQMLSKPANNVFAHWETYRPDELSGGTSIEIREFKNVDSQRNLIMISTHNFCHEIQPRFEQTMLPILDLVSE